MIALFRRFSFWAGFGSLLVCLFNYMGIDRQNLLFVLISIPSWIIGLVFPLQDVPALWLYAVTILFWFALGLICDWAYQQRLPNP